MLVGVDYSKQIQIRMQNDYTWLKGHQQYKDNIQFLFPSVISNSNVIVIFYKLHKGASPNRLSDA